MVSLPISQPGPGSPQRLVKVKDGGVGETEKCQGLGS